MTLIGTDITQVRESNRTERPPGSPFQSKGLDETERPGGVQRPRISKRDRRLPRRLGMGNGACVFSVFSPGVQFF